MNQRVVFKTACVTSLDNFFGFLYVLILEFKNTFLGPYTFFAGIRPELVKI